MSELTSGQIIIDSQDIAQLGLLRLRRAISLVPQQPVLFSGSIRKNLDPLSLHSDDEVILPCHCCHHRLISLPGRQVLRVLKLVKLDSAARAIQGAKEAAAAADARDSNAAAVGTGSADNHLVLNAAAFSANCGRSSSGQSVLVTGLDACLSENGGNLLTGQRQLLCLARALLHSSRIVCVEEAAISDNMSVETMIHRVIFIVFITLTIVLVLAQLMPFAGAEAGVQAGDYPQRHRPYLLCPRPQSFLRQIYCAAPPVAPQPPSIAQPRDAPRGQVLEDGSEGSHIAEMGRPRDLLADPSSLCAAPRAVSVPLSCALAG